MGGKKYGDPSDQLPKLRRSASDPKFFSSCLVNKKIHDKHQFRRWFYGNLFSFITAQPNLHPPQEKNNLAGVNREIGKQKINDPFEDVHLFKKFNLKYQAASKSCKILSPLATLV